ncbi:hypothetical protein ACOMHN_003642 [Nucella lapillus]
MGHTAWRITPPHRLSPALPSRGHIASRLPSPLVARPLPAHQMTIQFSNKSPTDSTATWDPHYPASRPWSVCIFVGGACSELSSPDFYVGLELFRLENSQLTIWPWPRNTGYRQEQPTDHLAMAKEHRIPSGTAN